MRDGYIPISRKFFEHPFWTQKRVFSYAEAWIDLIRLARYEDEPIRMIIHNRDVVIHHGELPISLRYLGQKWLWSKHKVETYLEKLVNEQMIKTETPKGTAQTVISICNYDVYNCQPEKTGQQKGQLRDSKGTVKGQRGDKTNKDNNNKENIPNGILKKDKLSSTDRIDYEALMKYFNETFKGKLPSITQITDKRKAAIKARIGEYGKEAVQEVFKKTLESDFLIGNNDRNWRCDFDWIFKAANFIKILEGNYENKSKPKSDMILTDNSPDKYKNNESW